MLDRFKVPEEDRVYVEESAVRAATEAIFTSIGLDEANAKRSTDVLIRNDLWGVETHGVSNMLRSYIASYRSGALDPRPKIVTERETPTTAVLDGGKGLGLHIAPTAMEMAIDKARATGMGAVSVHNVGHMGGAGYHAAMALDHDMIGLAMSTSGRAIVLPTWGAEPRLGTSPIAWAVPAGEMPPFVFDIGTSQIAQNKMRLAKRVGARIAPGWIARMDGTPVMEEVDFPDEYYLLPFGGTREMGSHKGYGLGSVVDILSSTLSGLGPSFLDPGPGFFLQAMRIDAFIDVAKFKADMDTFLRGLAETRPAPGETRVVYAGLLEAEEEARRRETGIPYHTEVIEWFRTVEREMGLDFSFT